MSGQLLEPFVKSLVALVGINMTWLSILSIDIFTFPISLSRYVFIPSGVMVGVVKRYIMHIDQFIPNRDVVYWITVRF